MRTRKVRIEQLEDLFSEPRSTTQPTVVTQQSAPLETPPKQGSRREETEDSSSLRGTPLSTVSLARCASRDATLPVPHEVDESPELRGDVRAAWVVQKITRKWRAVGLENPKQAFRRELFADHALKNIREAEAVD